jgi:hypothetical protein
MTAELETLNERVAEAERKVGIAPPTKPHGVGEQTAPIGPKSLLDTPEHKAIQAKANEEMNKKLDTVRAGPPLPRADTIPGTTLSRAEVVASLLGPDDKAAISQKDIDDLAAILAARSDPEENDDGRVVDRHGRVMQDKKP